MGGNYAGIPAACFPDDRGGGCDEHDDEVIMAMKVAVIDIGPKNS